MGIYTEAPVNARYESWFFKSENSSDTKMCGHLWTRETFSDEFPLKGIVYFAHGMGEHAFAYRHFGDRLATAGYALLAMDHFGHGKSDGARMSLGFDQAVKDYLYFIESTWTQYPATLPRFLLGQSFGGLLAIHVALHRQARWAGVILTAAAVGVDWDASKLAAYALFSTLAKCGILPDIPVLPAFSGREICRVNFKQSLKSTKQISTT
mmetsp:Transcript_21092/g.29202  ORF Transcript_21092/g.29202 Transcript_21092/m.29202 type:complete len:209 (+) Transcript_21092:212-838(+)